jgi:hypothetical protein
MLLMLLLLLLLLLLKLLLVVLLDEDRAHLYHRDIENYNIALRKSHILPNFKYKFRRHGTQHKRDCL